MSVLSLYVYMDVGIFQCPVYVSVCVSLKSCMFFSLSLRASLSLRSISRRFLKVPGVTSGVTLNNKNMNLSFVDQYTVFEKYKVFRHRA